ncbi:hypothetical protein [Pseudomonas panipatensis]|uniref:hypothetical protein n=1 Tax=Pseudomonas panipatensis TaxID=428992 RepID=UPI0035B3C603
MKGRILALAALLALGGCVAQQPQPESPPPGSQPGGNSAGATRQPNKPAPRTAITPSPSGSSAKSRSHTQFAPPPGGTGRWDASLGVYVIQGQKDLYYRQRTYYHWADGWYWGVSPNGPWTATDASGVPPGLNRRYAH